MWTFKSTTWYKYNQFFIEEYLIRIRKFPKSTVISCNGIKLTILIIHHIASYRKWEVTCTIVKFLFYTDFFFFLHWFLNIKDMLMIKILNINGILKLAATYHTPKYISLKNR